MCIWEDAARLPTPRVLLPFSLPCVVHESLVVHFAVVFRCTPAGETVLCITIYEYIVILVNRSVIQLNHI